MSATEVGIALLVSTLQIAGGGYHTCALERNTSDARCWGLNNNDQAPDRKIGPFTQVSMTRMASYHLH